MLGDRTFTCQSYFSFARRFKKFWQLFDSLLTHNWTDNGGWARFVWSMGLFPIVRTSIDGRGYRPRTRLHGNHLTSKYEELVFVSLFRPFSLPSDQLEWAIKSPPHKEQPKETICLASTGLLQGSNAGLAQHWAIRLDKPETWHRCHRNLESSTESEPEERKQEKPGCSCSAKSKLGWCSIGLCFLDVVPYKEDPTPSLFRTRFVGCYVLPCISIKLWRRTCKPY